MHYLLVLEASIACGSTNAYTHRALRPEKKSLWVHKFIFHTHMRANLQYLRYLCLQRELRWFVIYFRHEIQLLHVYCALRFRAHRTLFTLSFTTYSICMTAYPFTIFLQRSDFFFSLFCFCFVLCISIATTTTTMKRDLSSCICCAYILCSILGPCSMQMHC